jgi:hypothetical protein
MSASKATTRPQPDQRPLVLLALGLALCLAPLLSRTFFTLKNHQPIPPSVYLWLTGANAPEGLYRLTPESWRPQAALRRYGLAGLPLGADLRHPPLAAFRFQAGGEPVPSRPPAGLAPFFFTPIAVNQADRELLMTLPGIGPGLADGIIALRLKKKKLHQLDELLGVRGLGHVKIAKLEDLVSFD